ncbi:O-antigen ligase family protein [Massilia forsythiae]|uniref:O-antigen ligase family protein n=1 Tax=Massilia forsythiae TaxID=2728020 RepID=A0A7Z2VWI8_9BURK|nr:O-antigen ligase family protein [Massilia forsythiae]QJE00434.1 O-antigen ligase family protein [Massilia forsythiae]
MTALLLNFLLVDGHDLQRCTELVLLLVCVARIVSGKQLFQTPATMPWAIRLFLSAFFLLGLVSALAAWSPRHALYEWSSILLLVLLAHVVHAEVARGGGDAVERVLQWVGLACLFYSLRVMLMYAAALANGYQIGIHSLAIGFSNVRFLNHTQTALLPLIILSYQQAPPGGMRRRAWFALAAFWWSLLYVGEARASLVALAAGGVAVLCLRGRHAHGFLRAMMATALAGCALYVLLFVLLPECAGLQPLGNVDNVMARTTSDPASGRQFLWSRAVQLIVAHPWLGVGPLHFAHYGADLKIGAHPHDWILQVAVEWGLPALLCLFGAIGVGMRAFLRAMAGLAQSDRRQQETCVMFLAAILAIMVDALFSGVFVMPQSRLAVVLVVGCAAGWVRALAPQAACSDAPAARRPVTAMLVVFAACLLGWSVAPTLADRARHVPLRGAEQAANSGMHWPRMWEAGYF